MAIPQPGDRFSAWNRPAANPLKSWRRAIFQERSPSTTAIRSTRRDLWSATISAAAVAAASLAAGKRLRSGRLLRLEHELLPHRFSLRLPALLSAGRIDDYRKPGQPHAGREYPYGYRRQFHFPQRLQRRGNRTEHRTAPRPLVAEYPHENGLRHQPANHGYQRHDGQFKPCRALQIHRSFRWGFMPWPRTAGFIPKTSSS